MVLTCSKKNGAAQSFITQVLKIPKTCKLTTEFEINFKPILNDNIKTREIMIICHL